MEVVLVALDAHDRAAGRLGASRPAPGGVGSVPALGPLVGSVVTSVVERITAGDDPPLLPGRRPEPPASLRCVHRLVRLAPWDAAPALRRVLRTTGGRIGATLPSVAHGARRVHRWRVPSRRSRLVLEPCRPGAAPEERVRVRGVLHVGGTGRATPVELTLEPWSAHRGDLCLTPRPGRLRARLPRRYYDVAHLVMDELWHQIERAAPPARNETTTRRTA